MKKNLFLSIILMIFFVSGFAQTKVNSKNKKKNQTNTCVEKPSKETIALREKHANFLKSSPFRITKTYSKKESLAMGLPPNKYYEQNWELTMNPETGRPDTDKLEALRKQLEAEKTNGPQNRNPGDLANNPWIERGPTNVGGRTRAVMFDPNDLTNETAYAGGVSGGLWKNINISNPASIWTRVGIPENLAISCITVDPNNSQLWYVGTGESYVGGDANGNGLWKSTDGGTTWNNIFGGISGATFFNSASNFTVNSPPGIAGNYLFVEAPSAFSVGSAPRITTPITNEAVFQNDLPANTAATVCDLFPNPSSLSGKIALIKRGNCTFVSKVLAAQAAGAIACVIMNQNTDLPFGLGGTDAGILIPAGMISKTDGDILLAALANGPVNISLNPSDGSFTGNMVPGVQHINDVKIRNVSGNSEIYVAVGDTSYGAAGTATYLGGDSIGLYKSMNNGLTWTQLTLPLTTDGKKHAINDIEFGSDNKIYIATTESRIWGDGGGKVFSSTDGIAFTEKFAVPNGSRTQIAASKTTPGKVYIVAELNQPAAPAAAIVETKIFKTTDDFVSTTVLTQPSSVGGEARLTTYGFTGQQAGYDLLFEINPSNDDKLFAGGINLYDTADGGTTWTQKSNWTGATFQDVHSDQHVAVHSKNDATKMLFGNDGGVYYSNDGGVTVTSRNAGFNVTQFYSLGVAPTTNGMPGDNFVAGAQDNGSQMFLNAPSGLSPSEEVQGGDGAFSMMDQDGVDRYRVTNYVYNNTIRLYNYTTSALRSINTESGTTGDNGAFISPMALDSRLDILYSDYTKTTNNRVRRYKNLKTGGIQKAPLSNALLNSAATALMVSPFPATAASTSTLLIGTRGGRLLKVINADKGTTLATDPLIVWSNLTGAGFAGSVSDVEYGATENDIFVTFHNYNVVSVFYSADGGATWQNKEGNLPDMPVKCILQNPLLPNEVIIGTDLGVWGTTNFNDAAPVWTRSDNGMQNVRVTDMDLRNDNVVFAATYGRGVFSGAFSNPLSNAAFTKENKNVSMSPNPATNMFNLDIKDYAGKVNIQIVDVNGKLIKTITDENFNNQKSIDVNGLSTGIYVVKVTGNNLNFIDKLIKN
jgi:Secretion system C-terminal sorting domain/PA domain